MFITKIIIDNFQSHKHTEIDVCQGVNVFVGQSDHGKSSIWRALRWVFYNEPDGIKVLLRHGEKECKVTVHLSTGYQVTRIRSDKINRYIITDPDGKETFHDKFGRCVVPDEIKQILNVVYFSEDGIEEVNLAQQGKANNIIYTSGPNRARVLNKFTGVNVVDEGIASLKSDKMTCGKEIKRCRAEIDACDANITGFKELPAMKRALDALQTSVEHTLALHASYLRLQTLNAQIIDVDDKITIIDNALSSIRIFNDAKDAFDACGKDFIAARDANKVSRSLDEVNAKLKNLTELSITLPDLTFIDNYAILVNKLKLSKDYLATLAEIAKYDKILNNTTLKDAGAACDNITKISKFMKVLNNTDEVNQEIMTVDSKMTTFRETLTTKQEEFYSALEELGQCPLCGAGFERDDISTFGGV